MNFFQRPAKESGKSIQHDKDDIKVAGDTLQAVCEILKPAKLFFVSSRAYEAFWAYINNKENQLKWDGAKNSCNAIQMIGSFNNAIIGHSSHPGCLWWNRKAKNILRRMAEIITQEKRPLNTLFPTASCFSIKTNSFINTQSRIISIRLCFFVVRKPPARPGVQ